MPESLLRDLEAALAPDAHGGAGPHALLRGVDLDLPFQVQGYRLDETIGHVTVDGNLLVAYRMLIGGSHADVAVIAGRWLLAVHPASKSADLITWPRPRN
jgi:hypothetical protein